MNVFPGEALKVGCAAAAGVGLGGGVYAAIGGMGLTAIGTGVGITLGPLMLLGGVVVVSGYGVFRLGKYFGGKKVPSNP